MNLSTNFKIRLENVANCHLINMILKEWHIRPQKIDHFTSLLDQKRSEEAFINNQKGQNIVFDNDIPDGPLPVI